MDITPEELAKYRQILEREQEEDIKYFRKEVKYSELIEQGCFNIKVTWRDETSKLDMDFFKSIFDKTLFDDFKQNFR
jgi:hypothetical protein